MCDSYVFVCVCDISALEVDINTALLTKGRKREGQRERESVTLMVSANLQLAAVVSRALISL